MFGAQVLSFDSEELTRRAARQYQLLIDRSEHSQPSPQTTRNEEKVMDVRIPAIGKLIPFARGVSLRLRIA